jgi:hypothetical protein
MQLDKLVELVGELLCSMLVEVIIFNLIYSTIRCSLGGILIGIWI